MLSGWVTIGRKSSTATSSLGNTLGSTFCVPGSEPTVGLAWRGMPMTGSHL